MAHSTSTQDLEHIKVPIRRDVHDRFVRECRQHRIRPRDVVGALVYTEVLRLEQLDQQRRGPLEMRPRSAAPRRSRPVRA